MKGRTWIITFSVLNCWSFRFTKRKWLTSFPCPIRPTNTTVFTTVTGGPFCPQGTVNCH